MNLSEPFIRRPVMTTLVMVTLLFLGIWAYQMLPVSSLPDVNYPTINVSVGFPGANPEIMANTVATPLEKQFMTIPGIRSVISSSSLGSTTIVLQFDIEKDIDLAAIDVETAIVAAKPNLPPNLPRDPVYRKVNPAAAPIFYLAVTSPTMTQADLYDYANTVIGQRISTINGVADVTVYGFPLAVRAQVDPGYLATMGLSLSDLAIALDRNNQYQPLGRFDGTYQASTIYDNGGLLNAAAFGEQIVVYRNGAPIRVKDLGVVLDSLQNDRSWRRYVDHEIEQPGVTLAIKRIPGANTVAVANAIRGQISTIEKQLPGSLQLRLLFDRAESIRASIRDLLFTVILAFICVVLVIFLYLGNARDTLIPSLAMPMSIVATFAAIYPLGYTIDNLSLLAITLAIGFIVDDAIVVLENIVRWVEGGASPHDAALEGSRQISFTIISMTLSLVAVFIPLIFMAGLIGKIFQEFSITLSIVTLASGIISLTLTPMLCSQFIPPREKQHQGRMGAFSDRLNAWMLAHYEKGLQWVLGHRPFILAVGAASILLSLLLFKILPVDFLPKEDIGFLFVTTEAEEGTSSEQMEIYQKQVTAAIKEEPAVRAMMTVSGAPSRQGSLFIHLMPPDKRGPIEEVVQSLQKRVAEIPGLNVYFDILPLIDLTIGLRLRGEYQFLLQSLDSQELYNSALALYDKMRTDPTFQAVSSDLEIKTPQINVEILRDKASTLGIDVLNLEEALYNSLSGNRVSRILTPIDQYDVILEMERNMQKSPSSLNYIYLRSNNNRLVPLNAVANWSEGVGPSSVNHYNQFPAVNLSFDFAPGIVLSEGLQKLRELANSLLSPRVTGIVTGAAETFEESVRSFELLIVLTIFTIYVVLGILYESYIHPLTILSTLPPAILGGLLALFITGRPLSLFAYLGIILLIGIVKKNGIMMVDFALENVRHKGESPEKSIYDACVVRFRPIMMTTLAAIMGALPIAFGFGTGAESRRPLGYVIIGGLLVSQLITLFLTPVIYLYFEELRERFTRKL